MNTEQLQNILQAQSEILNTQKAININYYDKNAINSSQQAQDEKIKLLEQSNNLKLIDTRILSGQWTLTNLVINKPLYIIHSKGAASVSGYCEFRVLSGCDDLQGGTAWYHVGAQGKSACVVLVPKQTSIVIELSSMNGESSSSYDDTLRAYQ